MTAAKRAIPALTLAVLALLAAGQARAAVPPEGGQASYDLPLRAFDLNGYRSAVADADRSETELALMQSIGGTWVVYAWNPQSRTPSEMYGSGVDVAVRLGSPDDVKATAERVIQGNPATFKADLSGLRFLEATSSPPVTNAADGIHRPGKWAAHFQQTYHGLDVVGGEVHLTFTDAGRLFALGSTMYQDISVGWNPTISADRAKEIAAASVPYQAGRDSIEAPAKLLVLPVPVSEAQVDHHLAWRVRVHVVDPVAVWITDVDAHDGRILQRLNDVDFLNYVGNENGQVERYSLCDGSHEETYPYQYVAVLGVGSTYADGNGNWAVGYGGYETNTVYSRLLSPYVEVQNMQGSWASVFIAGPPFSFYPIVWDDSNSRADERDTYRTVQDIHNFFETFAAGFAFTNQLVTAQVNMNQTCNAYYNGNAIHFYMAGNTCSNTGQMMDVIAHEYGHGVQESILGGQGDEGLGEGNGDVLGFMMSGNHQTFRGWHNCTDGIRDALNTLQYPGDVVGQEIHYAGQVIAGFHWDAMQDQIARYGDWGKYSAAWDWHWGRVLQHPTTQPAQVLASFIANDNDGNLTNGTPQFNSYCLAATNHGFTCPSVTLPLANAACDIYHQVPQGFLINQPNIAWTAVGVLPSPGDDKDVAVYTNGYGTLLASSTGTVGADFVVGDFNHNGTGFYQPWVSYGGTTTPYVTEWDSGSELITVGTDINGSVGGGGGSCGMVQVWDVFLQAGKSYNFALRNNGGSADVRLSLFRNPAATPYWAGRSGSAFEVIAGGQQEYTAPAADWYGVVVFNNSPGSPTGYYTLRVQDSPVALGNAACQTWTGSPRMFGFTQVNYYWTGVAVNPSGTDDKDIVLYDNPAGIGSALAASEGTVGTDFVVGDFNHNPIGTYYSRVQYGITNASYVTEWDSGADAITIGTDVNGSVGGGSGACGLIQVWDVYLTAGQQYRFLLQTGGSADIRMSLFRNPSDGTYWGARGNAEFEAGNADGRSYTAPTSDWYGVVVFNNSPGAPAGNYVLRVSNFPATLASASCVQSTTVPQLFNFTQNSPYWTAVAINPSGVDDKDVWVFDNPDGLGSALGYSTGTQGTDYVIADFNHVATGTYYPAATYGASPANYVLEWDSDPDIFPIGSPVSGSIGGGAGDCGLVKVWDVFLTAGTTYNLVLTSSGAADIRVSLFRNPASAPYWGSRYNAVFEQPAAGTPVSYTAPADDYYGLVVFNASPDAPSGDYTLSFDNTTTVPTEIVEAKTGLTFQNPYPVGSPITLRASADGTPAHVEIYNVQGQMVRTVSDGLVGKAGRRVSWDGRSDGGARLGAGIYFLRARIGSERVTRTLLLTR